MTTLEPVLAYPEALETRLAAVFEAAPRTARQYRSYPAAKRLLDLLVAAVGLIVALPVLLVAALLIKLDSPGPVLYRHVRLGRGGRPFVCYKLRTMVAGAGDGIHRERMRWVITTRAVNVPFHEDPRITRVGRWLRRASLDELPQLWNVLRGEMTMVGPRPPLPYEVECYQDWQLARLVVRPGLTGYWQVFGRGRVSIQEMCRMDLEYIRQRTFLMDLQLLLLTTLVVLSGRGAG